MTDPVSQMEIYRDALVASGVRCALDGRDVNPPAVLIRPPSISYRFGRTTQTAEWTARVYLPDAGQMDAMRIGFPMLETIRDALGSVGVAILSASPADFQLTDGGTAVGFILTWNGTF